MAGHGPAAKLGKDNASEWKSKLGVILFLVYGSFYLAFVVISTIKPHLMEVDVFAGLNLATIYGMSLITLAVIMGVVYNFFCTKKEIELNGGDGVPVVEGGAE
jgi:uncharacterized membrane protein (DUF485 family)